LTANYYLWQGMDRMPGAERFQKYIKYMVFVLIMCFIVWLTPHTMVMTPAELKAMGGQQHPVLGNYGVMSAKNGAINTIITTTVLSFIIYQRANKRSEEHTSELQSRFDLVCRLLLEKKKPPSSPR